MRRRQAAGEEPVDFERGRRVVERVVVAAPEDPSRRDGGDAAANDRIGRGDHLGQAGRLRLDLGEGHQSVEREDPGRHRGSFERAGIGTLPVAVGVDVVDVELVQAGRAVRRVRVHAGRPDPALIGLRGVAPVAQPERVAHLVAGDVVATGVIGEEDAVARVEVEVDLLLPAPSVAARVLALRRVGRAVHPAGGAVLAVVVGEGDRIGLVGDARPLDHRQLGGRVVGLGHGLAQGVGQAIGQAVVEGDVVGQPVPDAGAARRGDRPVAAEERADLASAVVAEGRRRGRTAEHGRREGEHEDDGRATIHGSPMLRRAATACQPGPCALAESNVCSILTDHARRLP